MSDYKPLACLPVLPLRGIVVFPGCVTHFDVGRSRSARAVEEAMRADQMIFLVTQRDVQCDEPKKTDLYSVGTVAYVRQILRLPGDNMRILVEGKYRAQLTDMIHAEPYLFARAMELDEPGYHAAVPRTQALVRQAHQLFEQFIDLAVKSGQENLLQGSSTDDAGELADFIAQNATFGYEDKQRVLETLPPVHRLELCIRMMAKELDILRLESEINDQVQQNVNQNQRDYYLREQLHVIREELGEDDDSDADSYRTKIQALNLPQETEEKLLREVSRFARQQPGSAEASVLRNYLDTILDLPWNKETKERLDVKAAAKILDEDHFGLETVKKRILETLAVRQLAPELPGQILCLVGPPGVGKTSVAISIARALNRKLARLSLGGVRDEAEIRGHRKTYIGAMPGRIMTALIQAKSKNALLLLDEIDKLGSDYKGDPSSALLEVLDSAQNSSFRDHYIEVPFDLSHCMFITTANTTDTIPRALLDRMEVIELGSYTDEEKLQIAKRHLLPKQLKKHGIKRTQVRVSDDAIREIIACYTREAGVRSLDKNLAKIARARAKQIAFDEAFAPEISMKDVEKILGNAVKSLNEPNLAAVFIGLILGTLPSLWAEAGAQGRGRGAYLSCAASFLALSAVLLYAQYGAFYTMRPGFLGFLFCGLLWGLSLIVPGMTSSSILMAVGLFTPMAEGFAKLDMAVILPWLLGMALIVLTLARVVNWCFRAHYPLFYHAVFGIVLASTVVIIPLHYDGARDALLCLLAAALGALAAYLSAKLQPKEDA